MFNKMRSLSSTRKCLLGLTVICLAVFVFISGCGTQTPPPSSTDGDNQAVQEKKEKVTLYFGDKEAMFLIPEEREVVVPEDKSLEVVVLEELIKGPQNPELAITIPKEARVRSVQVENGIANVDFSKEFQTNHWGGSAGEMMTLSSVTNSLASLPGIDKVQFLLEGQKLESILGHADNTQPIAPNWDLVKK